MEQFSILYYTCIFGILRKQDLRFIYFRVLFWKIMIFFSQFEKVYNIHST